MLTYAKNIGEYEINGSDYNVVVEVNDDGIATNESKVICYPVGDAQFVSVGKLWESRVGTLWVGQWVEEVAPDFFDAVDTRLSSLINEGVTSLEEINEV